MFNRQQEKSQNKEQKPRKENSPTINVDTFKKEVKKDSHQNNNYNIWKDEVAVIVDDYDEQRRASEARQQLNYDA